MPAAPMLKSLAVLNEKEKQLPQTDFVFKTKDCALKDYKQVITLIFTSNYSDKLQLFLQLV